VRCHFLNASLRKRALQRGVRYPSADRIRDPHDVSDYVWVVCRVHRCDVAGVEGVVTLLHELEEVCGSAGDGPGGHIGTPFLVW
jgi:hypothetical protein